MSDEVRTILDLTYADYDGLKLGMDLYLPPPQNTPFPTIMYIPVGGWRASKRVDLRPQFAAHDFTQHGFALAVIDCRVTPDVIAPATVFDCKAGIRWLRAHAAAYGLDADKIGTCGRSAGGAPVGSTGRLRGQARVRRRWWQCRIQHDRASRCRSMWAK